MSAVIQQARAVLGRVRTASTPRPWITDVSYAAHPVGEFISANVVASSGYWDVASFGGADLAPDEGREERARADRALFLLTSDPDLLDAIDGLLDAAAFNIAQDPLGHTHATVARALDIAAVIVVADERMSA